MARAGSYRHYGEADVARVLLIRRAQALGFRLSELDGLPHIDTAAGWDRMAQLVAQLVARRRAAVAQELARLAALDAQLAALEAELHTCDTLAVPVTPEDCAAPSALALAVAPPAHNPAQFGATTTAGAARSTAT